MTHNNESLATTYTAEQIMEQAQVFASAWALVGGPFDAGDQLAAAEFEKDLLAAMVAHTLPQPEVKAAQSHTLEGTVHFMRSTDGKRCACCPEGQHIFCRYVSWDEYETGRPAHFGNGPDVFISTHITDLNSNESRRVRLTVEVLPLDTAQQQEAQP